MKNPRSPLHLGARTKVTRIHELAACHFIRQKRDAFLLGPPGVGKTHLAQAIEAEAIRSGFHALYRSIFDLVGVIPACQPHPRLTPPPLRHHRPQLPPPTKQRPSSHAATAAAIIPKTIKNRR